MEGRCAKTRCAITSINNLDDLSLMKILLQLPTAKFAIQCKLVCRRWHSLISAPHFVRQFIDLHDLKDPKPFAIILSHETLSHRYEFHIVSDDPVFKLSGFNLRFLPSSSQPVCIITSYKDLLLCKADERRNKRVYYICNPLTMNWVVLPPYPDKHEEKNVVVSFVSHDNSCRVVRFHQYVPFFSPFPAEIFSSETGQWRELTFLNSFNFFFRSFSCPKVCGWNSMLYWITGDNNIAAYNPYSPEQCHLINEPKDIQVHLNLLGVCQGCLHLLQMFADITLKLWKLDDYNTGKWNLKHKVCLKPLIMRELPANVFLLALDPNDEDMVYFTIGMRRKRIFSCNLQRKEVRKMDRILYDPDQTFSGGSNVFQLVLPWWPSMVPALT